MNETNRRLLLAEHIKTARRESFRTVDEARSAAGVARGTWDKAEKGESIKDFSLAAIEKALGWPPGFAQSILNGTTEVVRRTPGADLPTTDMQNNAVAGTLVLLSEIGEAVPMLQPEVDRVASDVTRLFRQYVHHLRGGDGNGSTAPNSAADSELSAVPDELPAAAKEGLIEESGEFNT